MLPSSMVKKDIQLGIHYYYIGRSRDGIRDDIIKIQEQGFKYIRIELECNPWDLNDTTNQKTSFLYSMVKYYNLKTYVIVRYDDINKLEYYINNWGDQIEYYQILNEPDIMSMPGLGLFMDDELEKMVNDLIKELKRIKPDAKTIINLTLLYLKRTNLVNILKDKVEFFGLDVYEESGLVSFPHLYKLLKVITNKEVFVTEFGKINNTNSEERLKYLMEGLSLFTSLGIKEVFLFDWNGWYSINDDIILEGLKRWLHEG
jgi:hypothetical protein